MLYCNYSIATTGISHSSRNNNIQANSTGITKSSGNMQKIDSIVNYTAEEIGKTVEKINNDIPQKQQKELEKACSKEFKSAAKKCKTIIKYHHDKLEAKIEKILGKDSKEKIKEDCATLATNVKQKAKDLKLNEAKAQLHDELKQAAQPANEAWKAVAEKACAPLIKNEDANQIIIYFFILKNRKNRSFKVGV